MVILPVKSHVLHTKTSLTLHHSMIIKHDKIIEIIKFHLPKVSFLKPLEQLCTSLQHFITFGSFTAFNNRTFEHISRVLKSNRYPAVGEYNFIRNSLSSLSRLERRKSNAWWKRSLLAECSPTKHSFCSTGQSRVQVFNIHNVIYVIQKYMLHAFEFGDID